MVTEFYEYLDLQRYSPTHHRQLKTYFNTHYANKTFKSPQALQQYIQSRKAEAHLVKTARVYLNYCEKFDRLTPVIIEKYRKFLKIPRHKIDVYVPSDEDVQKALSLIPSSSDSGLILRVLVTSGIRLIECLDFLKNYDQERFKQHQGFVSYPLRMTRGTKTVNDVYLPTPEPKLGVWELLLYVPIVVGVHKGT